MDCCVLEGDLVAPSANPAASLNSRASDLESPAPKTFHQGRQPLPPWPFYTYVYSCWAPLFEHYKQSTKAPLPELLLHDLVSLHSVRPLASTGFLSGPEPTRRQEYPCAQAFSWLRCSLLSPQHQGDASFRARTALPRPHSRAPRAQLAQRSSP